MIYPGEELTEIKADRYERCALYTGRKEIQT